MSLTNLRKVGYKYEGYKYFIGYQEDETVKPLCIILRQISRYRKCFEKGGKSMPFFVRMMKCWKNTIKFGVWLKKTYKFQSEPV